ncbi:MAG: hypothetical protein RMK73_10535 [Geminicoccaceae bacterium]|nr:hypothetical protein [Geminicoccaceae bacterium]MDW8341907.1 hypothetical protein [Geminicoccaceae bacterium]
MASSRDQLSGTLWSSEPAASWLQRLLWRAEAGLVARLWALFARLGPDRASELGARLLAVLGPRSREAKAVRANLRIVCPEANEAELSALVRANFAHFGRVFAEYPHLSSLVGADRVELVDPGGLLRAARRRPMVFASGHFANWEMAAGVAVRAGVAMTVVHARRANPRVTALLQEHRRALGCRFLDRDASPAAMLRELRAGRSIGVLVDQRHDEGDCVTFFGRPATAPLAPALLSARLRAPFVPVRIERLAGARFRMTIEPPIEPDPGLGEPREMARDMMQRLYRLFERWIRERPEEWLCIKRRWPDLSKKKWRAKISRNPRLAQVFVREAEARA